MSEPAISGHAPSTSARGEELNGLLERPARHPRATQPPVLLFIVLLSVAGSIIGLQLITTLGLTPNTALIGVLLTIAVSRIPLPFLRSFRSIHVQNLTQSGISCATYCAANSLLVPAGVPVLLGRPELMPAMLGGAALGMVVDIAMLYWMFDSRLFPGSGAWPHGIAAAEAIIAGDQGGRGARILMAGGAAGLLGSLVGVPAAALGATFIANISTVLMFGLGLLGRAYAPVVIHTDLTRLYLPHGMMVGAGLVALGQAILMVFDRKASLGAESFTRSEKTVRRALGSGFALYLIAALVVALWAGLAAHMSAWQLGGWILFAAVSCIAAEFIVGFSAMHAGWFPSYASALIFLILGMSFHFPPVAAALLVGFVAAGGPAFADGGYDLKAGWYLRGWGTDPKFDLDGRKQQMIAAIAGMATALLFVVLFHKHYFDRGLLPPIDRVYVATIRSGFDPTVRRSLLLWAIPGAVLQLAGGASRQLGVLFSTGLLLVNPAAGWVILTGIAVRIYISRRYRNEYSSTLSIFGAGCIAGNALGDFAGSLVPHTLPAK
jgi:uncharacterized oligopeptide transporter (OPT) family protein